MPWRTLSHAALFMLELVTAQGLTPDACRAHIERLRDDAGHEVEVTDAEAALLAVFADAFDADECTDRCTDVTPDSYEVTLLRKKWSLLSPVLESYDAREKTHVLSASLRLIHAKLKLERAAIAAALDAHGIMIVP